MHDVAVVGAGAAGLFAALSASGALRQDGRFARSSGGAEVLLLDGKTQPGKKILISGGGRCNVTNAEVTEKDFTTGVPNVLRSILREFPVRSVRTFFTERGVTLHEEPLGKVFPSRGRARDVLAALLAAVEEAGVVCRFGTPVQCIERDDDGWRLDDESARAVVIATGGLSVPETGSTGFGYEVARGVGHTLEETVPALAPLLGVTPQELSGVTVPAILSVRAADGSVLGRAGGSLLFTHRGVSGPAALDVSLAVEHALAAGRSVEVTADLWTLAHRDSGFGRHFGSPKPPGACLRECPAPARAHVVEQHLRDDAGRRGVVSALSKRLPRRLAAHLAGAEDVPLAQLTRERRREIASRVVALDLSVSGSEGFRKAEVTAGGVPLGELRRRSLESRLAEGLHFCGEVCDVTGRLGGFNFQWAWSSGFLAGRAAAASAESLRFR